MLDRLSATTGVFQPCSTEDSPLALRARRPGPPGCATHLPCARALCSVAESLPAHHVRGAGGETGQDGITEDIGDHLWGMARTGIGGNS
eukprot:6189097-Pleurochrysis_carterae.AAC.1